MALSQSALSEVLEAFRAGECVDLIREAVQVALQVLVELEATEVIGAARYERSESRTTERNGSRPRVLTTKAGDVQLAIPKLRKGSFFPEILAPRRRIDQALHQVIEAYVHGVSTRSVDDLLAALGGTGRSFEFRGSVPAWMRASARSGRTLGHARFPYGGLDATYLHVREVARGQVVSKAVAVPPASPRTALAGSSDWASATARTRRSGASSSLTAKTVACTGLLVTADQHAGLVKILTPCFAGRQPPKPQSSPTTPNARSEGFIRRAKHPRRNAFEYPNRHNHRHAIRWSCLANTDEPRPQSARAPDQVR